MGKAIRDFKRAMNDPDDASKAVAKTDAANITEVKPTPEPIKPK